MTHANVDGGARYGGEAEPSADVDHEAGRGGGVLAGLGPDLRLPVAPYLNGRPLGELGPRLSDLVADLEAISFGEPVGCGLVAGIVERLVPDELWELFQ
ncbi:hypothetical protein, partial [Streptomyces sp. NPDC013489]|uniref:hypothetical protein n=1 Tax=Streptomyces sp. NPDC013489 TaxID=3155606 RepID=UPI0033FF1FE8